MYFFTMRKSRRNREARGKGNRAEGWRWRDGKTEGDGRRERD